MIRNYKSATSLSMHPDCNRRRKNPLSTPSCIRSCVIQALHEGSFDLPLSLENRALVLRLSRSSDVPQTAQIVIIARRTSPIPVMTLWPFMQTLGHLCHACGTCIDFGAMGTHCCAVCSLRSGLLRQPTRMLVVRYLHDLV